MKKYYAVTNDNVTLSGVNGYGSAIVGVHIVGPYDETWSEMTVSESYEWFMQNKNSIIDSAETPSGIILDSDVTDSLVKGLVTSSPIDIYSVDELTLSLKGRGSFYNRTISGGTMVRTLYLLDSPSNSNNERTEDMSLNTITPLTEYVFKVASVEKTAVDASHNAIVITLDYQNPASLSLAEQSYEFVQTEDLTEKGIAVQPYGAILLNELAPTQAGYGSTVLALKTPGGLLNTESDIEDLLTVGATVTFAASESAGS